MKSKYVDAVCELFIDPACFSFQNILGSYMGMGVVFSVDYIFSWTNFIGLNMRYGGITVCKSFPNVS